MRVWILGYQCLQCGHQWKPRGEGVPQRCPACDSRHWRDPKPGEGPPPNALALGLRGLTWPDDQSAEDLEEILKGMRPEPGEEDDLMGIWKGSGPDNEVEEFLQWRRREGRREAEEFE